MSTTRTRQVLDAPPFGPLARTKSDDCRSKYRCEGSSNAPVSMPGTSQCIGSLPPRGSSICPCAEICFLVTLSDRRGGFTEPRLLGWIQTRREQIRRALLAGGGTNGTPPPCQIRWPGWLAGGNGGDDMAAASQHVPHHTVFPIYSSPLVHPSKPHPICLNLKPDKSRSTSTRRGEVESRPFQTR